MQPPPPERWRRLFLAVLVAVVASVHVSSASAQDDGDEPVQRAAVLNVDGHGWGHGRGMGQYGALGYALDYGWSSAQILDHFYGNTSAGTVTPSTMTVRLLSRDGAATTVTVGGNRSLVTRVGDGGSQILAPQKAVRITHVGGGQYQIADGPGCQGPFSNRGGTVSGPYVAVQAAEVTGGGGDPGGDGFTYGPAGAVPLSGDWNGDGIDTVGYRSGTWWHLRNSASSGPDDLLFSYGTATDVPVVGDWNGDGVDTIGVFRPSNGTWYLRNSNTSGNGEIVVPYGAAGDRPVTGDWDSDGDDTIGVVRGASWLLRESNTPGPADINVPFRIASDVPVAGDTDGDGGDDRNSYETAAGRFHLRDENFDGAPDESPLFGAPGSTPLIGDWDGDGVDDIGVWLAGTFTLEGLGSAAVSGAAFTVIDGANPALALADTLQLCLGGDDRQWLRGEIRASRFEASQRTVNALPTEQYLRSVVPRESPASWADLGGGAGMAALEAQAVAARSYSLAEDRYAYAKTCDTIACQVYAGRQTRRGGVVSANEDSRTDQAINATANQVRQRAGGTQRTEFSSSTGGYTAGGVFPAVADLGDDVSFNPNHDWSSVVTADRIESYYGLAPFTGITILERNNLGEDGGRVERLRIHFGSQAIERTGSHFQAAFGLRSDWFSVETGAAPPPPPPPPPPDRGNTVYLRGDVTSSSVVSASFDLGNGTDDFFAGDWDGDGRDSFAYRRGALVRAVNVLGATPVAAEFAYGRGGDQAFAGDWNGDGITTFAVRRGNTFYQVNRNRSGPATTVYSYGRPDDEVLIGDWNGDGRETVAVRRGRVFFISNGHRSGNADYVFAYGWVGDEAVIGDWDGDGDDTIAVRRGNVLYVANSLRSGPADASYSIAESGELLVGDWDGDGDDEVAIRDL